MKLSDLLPALSDYSINILDTSVGETEITHIAFNSNHIKPQGLFVAVPGYKADGHDYIQQAIEAGAAAVVGEQPISPPVPYIQVENSRIALALLCAAIYGHPDRRHTMIGITGTNGKTTTSYMIRHILQHAGHTCSMFSTVEQQINGAVFPSKMTTQNPIQLMEWLVQSKDDHVVMEVSSHGLSQHRTDGIRFDFALFTNLSHEHLDYHPSIEQYFQAKKRLFHLLKDAGEAIVNTHCTWGKTLKERLRENNVPTITYGLNETDHIQLLHVINGIRPTFYVSEDEQVHTFELSVPGFHNVWNALAAITVSRRMLIDYDTIAGALVTFPGVPGRLESYSHPNGARFIIDYAHTPDGVMQCLITMNVFKPRRIYHLFGFRGGRDYSKWKDMVDLSRALCYKTILTLDDLNGDSPDMMIDLYRSYADSDTFIIMDRTLAIEYVWNKAEPGDVVVLTGKGPEQYQRAFELPARSDAETIRYLAEREPLAPTLPYDIIAHIKNTPDSIWNEER